MPRRLTVKTGQPRYLTTRQSAVRLGVTINAIKAWIREERLPALKTPGGHHRISEPDLLEFHARLAENSRTPVSTPPRILVVDDDPSLLAALRETIEQVITEAIVARSEEHTSELQSQFHLVCRLLLEKKKQKRRRNQRQQRQARYRLAPHDLRERPLAGRGRQPRNRRLLQRQSYEFFQDQAGR